MAVMNSDDKSLVLTKGNVLLPLSVVLGLVGGGLLVGQGIEAYSRRLVALELRLATLEVAVEAGTRDRWTRTDEAQAWATWEALNPGGTAPPVPLPR